MCRNHCSIDSLRCGRGRQWKMMQSNPQMKEKMETEMNLREKFMECSHILQYRKEKRHGQRRVLRILKEHGSMTQRSLAEHFEIRPASLSELLIKLEDQGLIIREKLEEDRRNYQVSLSEKGLLSMEEVKKEHHHKDLFEVLNDEEKHQLSAILTKLKESWSEGEDIPPRSHHHHHHRNPEEKHS